MNKYKNELEDLQAIRMANSNNPTTTNDTTPKYENAKRHSVNSTKIKYTPTRKKKNKFKISRAIITATLIATIVSSVLSITGTNIILNNNNAIISTAEVKEEINSKIAYYENLMDMYADKENSIETSFGITQIEGNYQARVDYTDSNINNLANHLIKASKISESETRCAIIAAYNIINEPYRDEILGKALAKASMNQEDNSNYKIPGTTKAFLESLNYENWEEYNSNERNNIKDLKAAEEYVGGKNR